MTAETTAASVTPYVAYGSGMPKWVVAPIYLLFISAALVLMIAGAIFGPSTLHGVTGFMTAMMFSCALPFASLAAICVSKTVAWRLRPLFPDKLIVSANDAGIGMPDGIVIPYDRIRRIDPCSWRSRFGTDNWIEIDDGFTHKVYVNMALDAPEEILKQLRDRALAAGADLAPALPNGQAPSSGTQLGYRMGYLPGE